MRKLLHFIHLWLGLSSGLIILIVATTGALYVFEEELREAFQSHLLYVPKESTHRVSIKAYDAVSVMQTQFPKEKIHQIRFRTLPEESQKAAAILVVTRNRQVYSLHPYTGYIMGVRNMNWDAFTIIEELHKELLSGRVGLKDLGEQIIKWNVLVFFIMLLTGIVLWAPVNMRFLDDAIKNSFRIKWRTATGGSAHKRNYDMHRVAGFYAFAVMIMVAVTGIFWMFDAVEDSVYAAFGAKKTFASKPSSARPTDKQSANDKTKLLDRIHTEALHYGAPQLVTIQLPAKETDAIRVIALYPYHFIRKQNAFYFDQYSGTLLKSDLHENYTTPDKIRVSTFDLHTGRMFGLPSKMLWFMAALFTASLPITGSMLWWKKRKQTRRRAIRNRNRIHSSDKQIAEQSTEERPQSKPAIL